MTREEQIREASIEYQLSTAPRAIGGDSFADVAREMNVNQSFLAGAKWADKTMIEKACEWLGDMACYYAHWEINGDTYEKEVIYDTEKLIKDFKQAMKGGEK